MRSGRLFIKNITTQKTPLRYTKDQCQGYQTQIDQFNDEQEKRAEEGLTTQKRMFGCQKNSLGVCECQIVGSCDQALNSNCYEYTVAGCEKCADHCVCGHTASEDYCEVRNMYCGDPEIKEDPEKLVQCLNKNYSDIIGRCQGAGGSCEADLITDITMGGMCGDEEHPDPSNPEEPPPTREDTWTEENKDELHQELFVNIAKVIDEVDEEELELVTNCIVNEITNEFTFGQYETQTQEVLDEVEKITTNCLENLKVDDEPTDDDSNTILIIVGIILGIITLLLLIWAYFAFEFKKKQNI